MNGLQFSHGISLILLLIAVSGCKSSNKPEVDYAVQLKQSDYDSRVRNIFNYLEANKMIGVSTEQCGIIIILQTNLCNSCDKEKLSVILDSLADTKEPVYFIMAGESKEIESQIEKDRKGTPIFIDKAGLLPKHNISFLRNLKINICKRKITDWSFL